MTSAADDPLLAKTGLNRAGRRARGKKAINTRWAHTVDRAAGTHQARAAFDRRFELQVDPNSELDPKVRAKLAANARSAYMQSLALKRAKKQVTRERDKDGAA